MSSNVGITTEEDEDEDDNHAVGIKLCANPKDVSFDAYREMQSA